MNKETVENTEILAVAANLLYVACDMLLAGEVDSDLVAPIYLLALELDGNDQIGNRPMTDYTKDELIKSLKEYSRLIHDKELKIELNNMLRHIEGKIEDNFQLSMIALLLENIIGPIPMYHMLKENNKVFYNKAFSSWFKNLYSNIN